MLKANPVFSVQEEKEEDIEIEVLPPKEVEQVVLAHKKGEVIDSLPII